MASTRPRRTARPSTRLETAPAAEPVVAGALPIGVGLGESSLARPLTLPGVTLEGGVYAAIVLVALLLRFWRLGALPLTPAETRTALASLDITRGGLLPGEAGALLGFGDALAFMLAGVTDATARFVPAIVGGLAPLTLLLGRPLIGRGASVIAALLLALSPLLLDGARSV